VPSLLASFAASLPTFGLLGPYSFKSLMYQPVSVGFEGCETSQDRGQHRLVFSPDPAQLQDLLGVGWNRALGPTEAQKRDVNAPLSHVHDHHFFV
jgi:hypothetical protein